MAVAQVDGSYAPTTMCMAPDGKWRAPNAPSFTASPAPPAGCKPVTKKNRWANVLGGVGESLLSTGIGKLGLTSDAGMRRDIRAALTDSFACALDAAEQTRAANATNKAVSGQLGKPVTWVSDTRPGVTGSSTATGETRLADGTTCRSITDIVIVNGEETRVQKQLCRPPGASGYSLTPTA